MEECRIRIREYTSSDYKAVTNIWKQCFSIKLRLIDSKEILNRLIQHSPGLFLIAESDDKIVGTVFAGYDGRQATIHRLAVLPEYQQKGIGKSLLAELLRRLELLKPIEVITHAMPDEHVIDIFESFDFVHCETKHLRKKIN